MSEPEVSRRDLAGWFRRLEALGYPEAEARAVVAYAVTGEHEAAAEWLGIELETYRTQHQLARDRAGRAFERGMAIIAPQGQLDDPGPVLRDYLRDVLDPNTDNGLRIPEIET